MLVDTHCHLDAPEFDADRDEMVAAAARENIGIIVVPGVERGNLDLVCGLADRHESCALALGIHPLFVDGAGPEDLDYLAELVEQRMRSDNPPVAIGEIGLDFFIEGYDRERQEYFYSEQLKLARRFGLPVILHVRRSVDHILKHLRRIEVAGGIAHAYNGSRQQADQLVARGFKLGFGGAMTYPRSLHIRELARTLPEDAIVLETDAPDIPPEWLGHHGRNRPDQLPKIAAVMAELRQVETAEVIEFTTQNAFAALPKLADLYTPPQVQH